MTKETMQKLREQKLKIEKKIAEGKRQEADVKRKARTHALIVIASAIFTEAVVADLKIDLIRYSETLREKSGLEKHEYLRSAVGRAMEAQEQELKEAEAKTKAAKTKAAETN